MHRLLLFALLFATNAQGVETKEAPLCAFGKEGSRLQQRVNGYRLTLTTIKETREGEKCIAALLSPSGRTLWHRKAFAYSFPTAPTDINNDGNADIVLEEYWGGAHCCWTYRIFSFAGPRRIALEIENERDMAFDQTWRGKRIISTLGGEFDYFHTSHAASFFPPVYLLLDERKLIDISGAPEFRAEYDALIKEGYEQLRKIDSKRQWRRQRSEPDENIRSNILQIVLSYLYSRRANQAWKALSELWPEYDVVRMKKEILDTRKDGVLKHAVALRAATAPGS
jgi:hypothetical protein